MVMASRVGAGGRLKTLHTGMQKKPTPGRGKPTPTVGWLPTTIHTPMDEGLFGVPYNDVMMCLFVKKLLTGHASI